MDQDGNFYHEACVYGDGERTTLIRPKTIPSFIEKLITSEDIDYHHIVEPHEGGDQQLLVYFLMLLLKFLAGYNSLFACFCLNRLAHFLNLLIVI